MSLPPDNEQFVKLIEDHKGIIYKVCNSYCTERQYRDDLAQEIVYQLWRSFASFNNAMKFSTWMYRIALNVAISFYRRESKKVVVVSLSEHLMDYETSANNRNEEDPNIKLLMLFINELKAIDKSIMILYLDDKSYKEIAEITGITESNVATRINRIKEKIKSKFSTSKITDHGTK